MSSSPLPSNIRVAVVGCGQWGRNLVRNFHELGALAAVHDSDADGAARIAARHGVPACSFDAILEDPAIPAVAIAAPAEAHHRLARAALLAGKHTFVEKPLALGIEEAEELCRLADANGRVLMVGHLLQYHPAFLKLKEMVGEGAFGRLQYVYSNRLNLGRVRREENILWSFAPHDISMILSLVGNPPTEVLATGAAYLHKVIVDVTTTHIAFAGGEKAHIFVSWLHPFKEQKLVVVGDRGMAVFDDGQPWASKLVVYPHHIDWMGGIPTPAKADAIPVALKEAEPLHAECTHFLECVAQNRRPRTDGAEGVRVLRVLQAAQRSMDAGCTQRLDTAPANAPAPRDRFTGATIHATACIDAGVEIAAGTKIWHFSHILPGTRVGRDCTIGQNVVAGPDVTIADRCKIQNNVSIYKGVTLEEGVFCGPSCVFTNVINPRAEIERKDEFRPTLVRRGATIGANATILCGVTLGAYCMVGAGAVVTRDVPDYALVVGNPARRIGWVSRTGDRLGPDLICPRTGQGYRWISADSIEEIPHG